MKEIPMMFTAEMVRAILEGRKTMTRRAIKRQADIRDFDDDGWPIIVTEEGPERMRAPVQVGDNIWVKETYALICHAEDGQCYCEECTECSIEYRADNPNSKWAGGWCNGFPGNEVPDGCKWRSSMFMPKAYARIKLEVTGIRADVLEEISDSDAIAEGIASFRPVPGDGPAITTFKRYQKKGPEPYDLHNAASSFYTLWTKINGEHSWLNKPWVWVIIFKKIEL